MKNGMCAACAVAVSVLAAFAGTEPNETVLRGMTPEQARDAIREMKKKNTFPDHDVVVELEGTFSYPAESFRLGSLDGGKSPTACVVYRAGKKGAVFTGAVCLKRESFAPVKDPAVLARLRPEARGKVVCCDLKALGQTSFPVLPDQIKAWDSMDFFVNGEAQTLARYPNDGWLTFNSSNVVDRGVAENKNLREPRGVRGGTFRYPADDPRPASWDLSKGVWALGYWNNDWVSDTLRIEKIDGAAHTVTTKGVHYLGIGPNDPNNKEPRRYFFLNLLEELDAPGEWYVDCASGVLYWYPIKGKVNDIKFVNHPEPIMVARDTRNIVFDGIRFECNTESAFQLLNCWSATVRNCEISYISRVGVLVRGGNESVFDSCIVHHIGSFGISMESGNRRTLVPSNSRITNCEIYRTGRFVTSSKGIRIEGCGIRVDHNYVHDTPYGGIIYYGNDHTVELNEVAFTMMESGDGGGIYTGRDWTSQGNVCRWNYLHHFSRLGAEEKLRRGEKLFCQPLQRDDSNGIYLDDCDSGDECYGNLIFKVGYGYQLGGGRDNRVHDNVIAGCVHGAALADARGYRALRFKEGNDQLNGWNMLWRLNWIGWDKDPFRKKYPWTADYLTNDKFFPVRTTFSSNIVVNCQNLICQGSCKERGQFIHEMNFRDNRFFGPRGNRDDILYPVKDKDKFDKECVFGRDAELEKLFADATDLRKVVKSAAFRKRFPNFPKIPVDEIGLLRNGK